MTTERANLIRFDWLLLTSSDYGIREINTFNLDQLRFFVFGCQTTNSTTKPINILSFNEINSPA